MSLSMKVFDLIVCALAMCACTKEAPSQASVNGDLLQLTFRGSVEECTRTSLGSGYSTVWSKADKVTLFSATGTSGATFSVSSTESGGTVATFTGLTPQSSNGYYYALYPASSVARLVSSSGTISAELPTVQTGVQNSFPAEAALSVACVDAEAAEDNDILHFRNVGALLGFTVPGNYLTRVRIESCDKNVAMSGPANIDYNNGSPVVTPLEGAKNYVEVMIPEGTIGKRYYAVAYPGNYASGFKVTFYTAVNYYNRYTSSLPLDLQRNGNVLLIDKNWAQNDDRASTESGYEQASSDPLDVRITSASENYYNFIVNYSLTGVPSTGVEHGLVFSYSASTPTCGLVGAAGKLHGPVLTGTGNALLMQCVPNSILCPGEPCYVRAYCYDPSAGNYVYSPVITLTLPAQPQGLGIANTPMDSPADGITLFSFVADGSYNGFCATADCSPSSPIRLGVNNAPLGAASALSMSSQQDDCGAKVLLNGQIFGNQGNIGLAYTGGSLRYNNSDAGIESCCYYGNTFSTWQPVTRAILGIDSAGKPSAYWCSLIGGKAYFFDRPIPAGSAKYPQVTASSGPGPAVSWSPQEALSTGPMLLYGGNVCVSEDRIETGVYYTNYELWETTSGNIYGSSRPRSAIGYDSATGKIYLVAVTTNITLTRFALIMKGLGCDYAMNLDGGGSTQMFIPGVGELTSNNRNVKSTIGFFLR